MSTGITVRARTHTRKRKRQKQQRSFEDIARDTCITVQVLPVQELEQRTLRARKRLKLPIDNVTENVPCEWQLGYIRHELTEYESVLSTLRNARTTHNISSQNAYYIWRCRVIRAVGCTYPHLRNACIADIQRMPIKQLRSLMPNDTHWLDGIAHNQWYAH